MSFFQIVLKAVIEIVVTWALLCFVCHLAFGTGMKLFMTPINALRPIGAGVVLWIANFIFVTCIAGGLRALWLWLTPDAAPPPSHPSPRTPHGKRPVLRRRRP